MSTSGKKYPGVTGDGAKEQGVGKPGAGAAKTGDKGDALDQVSNDMSDAKEAPEDAMPKDNSHNFT